MISYNNSAPTAVNTVGQFGATEGSIGAYKSAAEYAADSKYWALLSQKGYDNVGEVLKEVERLFTEGALLKEDIEDLRRDFENQNQILVELVQQTGEAIDNTNAATENANQAVRDVLAQLDKISNMSVVASTLPPGTPATGSFDNATGVFSFGIPEGLPGKDGKDGVDGTISDIGDVAIGTPVSDDYGFFVDKADGGIYRTPMSEIAKLVPAVASFNGRVGQVVPAAGDYTVAQVTGAAASGVNSDINQIRGLTTALSVDQGGTGATTAEGARVSLVAAKSGDNSDITSMSNKITFTQSPVIPDAVDDNNAATLGQLRNSIDSNGILTNKQAIARVFGVKQSEVTYIAVDDLVNDFIILYDKSTQTCWYKGTATGNVVSWTVSGNTLTLITNTGTYPLVKAVVYTKENLNIIEEPFSGYNVRQDIINREKALTDNTRIRIVTWNAATGFQITGWEPNRDFSSSLIKERIRQEMLKIGGDFVGLQECWSTPQSPASQYAYYPYIDSNSHITTIDHNSRRFGTGVISTRPITSKSSATYTGVPSPADPADVRGYTRNVISVGGNQIAIYNTHMSLNATKRTQDIAQLFTAVDADAVSRVVVTGDWNTETDSDFAAFTNAGFGMINHTGEFNSNNHVGDPYSEWYIDRILYKGFSSVADKGVMAVPYEMSDHRPVFVELVL